MKWQEMDTVTRRKAIIFALIVVVCFVALLWPAGTMGIRRKPVRKLPPGDPRRVVGRGNPDTLHRVPASPPSVKGSALLGKWETETTAATKRGVCMLQLEVTRKPGAPDQFGGAATLKCVPVPGLNPSGRGVPAAVILAGIAPLSAAMTGTWDKGIISFRIDRQFNAGDCGWTGLSVSRFGSDGISAEYHDACGGGAMVMRKAG